MKTNLRKSITKENGVVKVYLSKNLQFLIEQTDLRQVAKTCDVPLSTLHGWTNGSYPSLKSLHKIARLAKHFNILLEDLLFYDLEKSKYSKILIDSKFEHENEYHRIILIKEDG